MTYKEFEKLVPEKSQIMWGELGPFTVANLKTEFGLGLIGIYDERPLNDHIDYLNCGNCTEVK